VEGKRRDEWIRKEKKRKEKRERKINEKVK
jgi:hypothetical protein